MTYGKTETAGFYQARLARPSNKTEVRNFAVNVDAAEGDLLALAGPDLAPRLAPLKYDFAYASHSTPSSTKPRAATWATPCS